MATETMAMSDIFSIDVSPDLDTSTLKTTRPNELIPTRPIPPNVHEENFDSDEDAPISIISRNKKRIYDSENEDSEHSSKINVCDRYDENQENVKKNIPKPNIFSSSDESDIDLTNRSNRRFLEDKEQNNRWSRKETVKEIIQLDLLKNSTTSCESNDDGICVPIQVKNLKESTGKIINSARKFRNFMSSKTKSTESLKGENTDLDISDVLLKNLPDLSNICDDSDSSEDTNTDGSIIKVKRLKKQSSKKVLADEPQSSDEEEKQAEIEHKRKKSIKAQNYDSKNSSKPLRMSAKQAMKNRQVIKSESNRMLRDKQVTLPYHRPKPLSLKEIINRRRPTLMLNGKELPIKMNEEQLKHYALQLQQQQKELIELCKSDSEDEKPPGIPQEHDQGTKDDKVVLDNVFNTVNNDNDGKVSTSNTKIENNTLEFHSTTTDDVDIPSADFVQSESFIINNENNNKMSENKELLYIDTELPKCDDSTVNNINTELNNGINENQIIADKEKSDYYNVVNSINYKDNTLIDREQTLTCINHEISNCDKELVSNAIQGSQLIDSQYDSEENKIAEHDRRTKTVEKYTEVNNSVLSHTNGGGLEKSKTKNQTNNIEDEYNINSNANCVNSVSILLENVCEEIENIDMFDTDFLVDIANKKICNKSAQDNNTSTFMQDHISLNVKPKLKGSPGMVIDLDGDDPIVSTKMSGIELLKQRFQYFTKIKTPNELEGEKEKKIRPGTLHSTLKQELEDKIAEQRSLEWTHRLEEQKQNKLESNSMNEDKANDNADVLESIEAKLNEESDFEEKNTSVQEFDSEEESESDDFMYQDDSRKKNPLIADEAEESGVDDVHEVSENGHDTDPEEASQDDDLSSDSEESSESSGEDESNEKGKKKSRILKAFEDSDDEDCNKNEKCRDTVITESVLTNTEQNLTENTICNIDHNSKDLEQLSQIHKTQSEDLFASQNTIMENNLTESPSSNPVSSFPEQSLEMLPIISTTQIDNEVNLDDVALMCSGTFSQNLVTSQSCTPVTQFSDTEKITEHDSSLNGELTHGNEMVPLTPSKIVQPSSENHFHEASIKTFSVEENLLHTILNEMDEADLDNSKPNKYFCGDSSLADKANKKKNINVESKKKYVIESDEEETEVVEVKNKYKRKRNHEKRILQISDDEEELSGNDSEFNEDIQPDESSKNIVEYDSEENEVEVLVPRKLERKARDFLEQEAELTSEDEWIGSGDEDEAGLDRMEREEGDDESFNQGKLRNELGQIHMRDVLDQDKREVRLLQELLLEDGDLGEGHRQRKFRWKNADGEEMIGTVPNELNDTQEEEFESEELWRKQRHERETFLRQMKDQDTEIFNTGITRNMIIKANLNSKSISSLLMEVSTLKTNEVETVTKEKNHAHPNPAKEHFPMFQQQPRSSLLSRGKGTLERLAALATPLAAGAEQEPTNMSALAPQSKRNFVFTILTPPTKEEKKVAKRKATLNAGTSNLMKKMKINEEKQKTLKKSILEQIHL